jgi:D-sedoheptulose 7-phosphate isomerase
MNRLNAALLATEASLTDGSTLDLDTASSNTISLLQATDKAGGKIMIIGNGGSAAVASHMQNDLCKAGNLQAMVFTEQPLLTAYSNDDGYDKAYESMVKLWGGPKDVLIAISSSGSSENILNAVNAMNDLQGQTITLSGFAADNPLRSMGNVNFFVDSDSYGIVETAHAALGHYLTDSIAELQDGTNLD